MRRLSGMLRGSASAQVYLSFLAIAGVSGSVAHAAGADAAMSTSQFDQRWDGWASATGNLGSGGPSYGDLSVFVPLSQDASSLWFSQIDGKMFDGGIIEGNVAVGRRQMTSSGFNIGFWGGLDVRKTASDNVFAQVSGGVEALSEHFDFRANGYLPINGAQTAAPGVADVILNGTNIFMVGGQEVPLYGVDAEAGVRLPFPGNRGHIGVYGGGYWFDNADVYQAITGVKARVELALNDVVGPGSSLTAEYQYSNDAARGVRQVIGAGLRIPFGGPAARPARATGAQQWRMTDPLVRDTDIVIGQSGKEQVADGYTDVRFDRVAYANDGASLQNGIDQGGHTLIILDGANNPVSGGETLGSQQTLLGGGGTLKVTGVHSGATGYVTAPGSRPTIENTSGSGYALTLSGYNTVDGVDVVSELADSGPVDGVTLGGIDGSGKSVLAIVDTNVSVSMAGIGGAGGAGGDGINDSTLTGINLANADQVWLNNVTVSASMAGTGGAGGFGPDGNGGGFAGGGGGIGISGSTINGINLADADHVWLNDTTVSASMTGIGGAGGRGGNGTGTSDPGGSGGSGGTGISNSTLTGVDLSGTGHVWLTGTSVSGSMTGIGGAGGDGGDGPNGGIGGAAGGGGTGIDTGTLAAIDLSSAGDAWLNGTTVAATMTGNGGGGGGSGGFSGVAYPGGSGGAGIDTGTLTGIDLSGVGSAWLTGTTVSVSMAGTGGTGGAGGGGVYGGSGGTGGAGIDSSTLVGIDLSSAGSATLTDTTVTATMIGTGGTGGTGSDGGTGGDGGNGGTGIDGSTLYGIDLSGVGSALLNNTTVTASLMGYGGAGSNGGNGGDSITDGHGGVGGVGITGSTLYGINLSSVGSAWLNNTTVNASMIGTGGHGGNGAALAFGAYGGDGITGSTLYGINLGSVGSAWLNNTTVDASMIGTGGPGGNAGFSGTGIGSSTPYGLYPDTMPIPGVTLSGSTVINVTP